MKIGAHPLRGYLFIGTAAFFWGIAATLGRAAFTGRIPGLHLGAIDPLILSQSRTTLSLLVLLPTLLIRRGATALRVPRADLIRFLLLGVLGVAASNYLYYLAIQRTNVAIAIILQYTAPVWVLLYTVLRGGPRPSFRRIAAVALAVAGCGLAVGLVGAGGLRLDALGVTAALLAAFSFAFYNVGGHSVLARYDRWKVLLWVLASAATFWIFINPPWRVWAAHYGPQQWGFMLIFSLVSVLGPFSCYFAGLQYLEPTRAVVASCLEPVFSIVIATIALGELLRPLQTVGIVVVLVAIILIQWPSPGRRAEEFVLEPIERRTEPNRSRPYASLRTESDVLFHAAGDAMHPPVDAAVLAGDRCGFRSRMGPADRMPMVRGRTRNLLRSRLDQLGSVFGNQRIDCSRGPDRPVERT